MTVQCCVCGRWVSLVDQLWGYVVYGEAVCDACLGWAVRILNDCLSPHGYGHGI